MNSYSHKPCNILQRRTFDRSKETEQNETTGTGKPLEDSLARILLLISTDLREHAVNGTR